MILISRIIIVLHAETKKYDLSSKLMCYNINMFTFVRLSNIEVDYTISYLFFFSFQISIIYKLLLHSLDRL